MRWVGHVSCVGEKRNEYRILMGKLKERALWETCVLSDERILKWILKKSGSIWAGII
jgi:hypothetical protein